jgi:hypothetical protein
MRSLQRLLTSPSPRLVGVGAAIITVLIWTSFILIARASADPARGGSLTSFDLAFCRILGASLILLPWSWALGQRNRAAGMTQSSLMGLSPLPLSVVVK